MNKNPFDVLGLDESASTKDVKKAYFQLVKQFTPEKHADEFKQIRKAYDLLKDAEQRIETEVFHFTKPPEMVEAEASLPQFELDRQTFLAWIQGIDSDLERSDFSGDFDDI